MKIQTTIPAFFIYLVSIFGAIDFITSGVEPKPNAIIFLIALLAFGLQVIYKKRLISVDTVIAVFTIISYMGLAVFLSDLFFHPVAVEMDCLGHEPKRIHYFDFMFTGIITAGIFGFIFIKTHKQKMLPDRICSLVFIIVLVLCYYKLPFHTGLKNSINKVSRPTYTLPKGC